MGESLMKKYGIKSKDNNDILIFHALPNETTKFQWYISENIKTISEMIKDFDIDVKTANGGKEAIELIDSFKPDVILLDLMMPHVNGWDVIDHVRSKYSKSEMAIIVVSLLSNKDNVDECYELGVNDYITKPIIKARLTSSLDAHLNSLVRG